MRNGRWQTEHRDGECPAAPAAPVAAVVAGGPDPVTPAAPVTPGLAEGYVWVDGDGVGRLQRSAAGHLYLKMRTGTSWDYVPGGMRRNLRPMTLEEAKQYGRRTGTCCICGAHLENPESVAAGIGPICATKF
jgi:hypothetical protein